MRFGYTISNPKYITTLDFCRIMNEQPETSDETSPNETISVPNTAAHKKLWHSSDVHEIRTYGIKKM